MFGVIDDTKLANIAGAIRKKTGAEKTYKPEEMASGVNEVYDTGEKSGYDKGILAMWDAKTNKGRLTTGVRFFNQGYYDDIEELPYPIAPTDTCANMFYNYAGTILPRPQYVDLSKLPADKDVGYMFGYCGSSKKGVIDVPDYGLPAMNKYSYSFLNATGIKKIKILRTSEKTTFTATFSGATYLSDIIIEGVIGQNISFLSSPLTIESMISIITHLKDYSGTENEFTYTLTLKSDCWTALDAEGATAPGDVTWRDYVTILGWKTA